MICLVFFHMKHHVMMFLFIPNEVDEFSKSSDQSLGDFFLPPAEEEEEDEPPFVYTPSSSSLFGTPSSPSAVFISDVSSSPSNPGSLLGKGLLLLFLLSLMFIFRTP